MFSDHLEELGFCKLQKKDISALRSFYDVMDGSYASSVALFSIFSWSHSLPAFYQIAGDYLIFIVFDRIEKRWVFLPPIGRYQRETFIITAELMSRIAEQLEIPLIYTDISEWMVPYFKAGFPDGLEIIQDRNLSEYIYDVDVFLQYQDRQRERYNYQYFQKKYHPRCVEADISHGEECKEFLQKVWCSYHSCEECEYGCQKETIDSAMKIADDASVKGILVYVEEKLAAYVLVTCEKDQLVFHFKKNERGYRGLNEYIHRECVERFAGTLKKINYTEDMGSEGLRNYKQNLCAYRLEDKLEIHIGDRRK